VTLGGLSQRVRQYALVARASRRNVTSFSLSSVASADLAEREVITNVTVVVSTFGFGGKQFSIDG
jgi:hypothetical protein